MTSQQSPASPSTSFARRLPLIGLWQGLLLWALTYGPDAMGFTVLMPVLFFALIAFVGMAPLLWCWTEQAELPTRRRWLGVPIIALVVAMLPIDPLQLFFTLEAGEDRALASLHMHSQDLLPLAILAVLSAHLLLGWRITGARGWDYERLFRLTWRNTVLTAVAAVLTGAVFGVLFAGAGLLNLIGIGLVWNLLQKPGFILPMGCMTFGGAFALGLLRAKMLVVMRHFWLSLTAWLLPLVLAFVFVWVAAVPFTGLASLLDTRHAAVLLLGVAAMCVNFANSVYQDGRAPSPLGPWLSRITRWIWPALGVVVAVAGWALWQRVQHRGWSGDRIWAALVWLVAVLYTLGYAASAWRRGTAWLPSIGRTNVFVACLIAASLLFLLTPWFHPEALAVRSQLSRLQQGRAAPEDFDFRMLYRDDRYGRPALEALAARAGTPRDEAIAKLAKEFLAAPQSGEFVDERDSSIPASQLRAKLKVLPAGSPLDADLLNQLRGASLNPHWALSQCRDDSERCALWMTDLNRDGRPDAVLISQHKEMTEATVHVFEQDDDKWRFAGELRDARSPMGAPSTLSLDHWVAAIEHRRPAHIVPIWDDLDLDGTRWQMDTSRAAPVEPARAPEAADPPRASPVR